MKPNDVEHFVEIAKRVGKYGLRVTTIGVILVSLMSRAASADESINITQLGAPYFPTPDRLALMSGFEEDHQGRLFCRKGGFLARFNARVNVLGEPQELSENAPQYIKPNGVTLGKGEVCATTAAAAELVAKGHMNGGN